MPGLFCGLCQVDVSPDIQLRYRSPMTISFIRLGWRTTWRDLRAGELRLLLLAVTLAVAALTSVGFFADRLRAGLQRDAGQLLGGDAVVVGDEAISPVIVQQALQTGLRLAQSLSFPTMARADDAQGGQSKLVSLKAVQPGYPLRGSVRIRSADEATDHLTRDVPEPGQAWVDAPLLDALGLRLGDRLLLGDSALQVTRIVVNEPDRGAGFMNFAPRVLINWTDVAATGLVQPASRVRYRMAVAGDEPAVQAFVEGVQAQILAHSVRGLRVDDLQGGRPELNSTLNRAEKFLNLVALLAALLSAVAVALAARNFATHHLDDCAMLRVLGLPQRTIALAYAVEFGSSGLLASALGVALGYAAHHLFVLLLADLLNVSLPTAGYWPVLLGLGMGLSLLLAFGIPPVLQLARVPALRVIRRDVGNLKPASVGVLMLGLACFASLLLVASSDLRLGWIAVSGFAVATGFFSGVSWLAVKVLRYGVNEATAPMSLVLATRQIAARPAFAVLQVSSLAVGMLALVLLVLLRTDLIESWRKASPANAPNRFVINVMPEQAEAFKQALRTAGVTQFDWFPMIRGRLIAVNAREVNPDDYSDERARRLVDREFNLSHSAQLPGHNPVVAGRWLSNEANAISMEEGIARTLGIGLGDRLRFDVGGTPIESTVTSLRKVDWASMRANFFAMYPVDQLSHVPVTYMAAFRQPNLPEFDRLLVRQFPNITAVDVTATVGQIQRVLDQVIAAVEFLFLFTLAAGLVVLFAAVSATREARTREFAIMRAVGARASLLCKVQRIELIGLGCMAGLLAAGVASVLGWALARFVFEFDWLIAWWVLPFGAIAGALLAWGAGWWGLREVLISPVMQTLRRSLQS